MTSGIRRLNHYDVGALLGRGGMGAVYRATDTKLGRDVALKVLPPEFTDDDRLARFRREARALAALNHPNIVTIYSVEECDGVHFLTMELVDGHTLEQVLEAGALPWSRALPIALPLADAVAAAHAAGITHRDLKPQNVLIGRDGRVKVLDFGLARFADASDGSAALTLTQEGMMLGTLPYMAPEQIDGRSADARSDVYALGVVLYEMVTGRRPFVRDSAIALLAAIVTEPPTPVGELAPDTPEPIRQLIDRSLAKDPTDRWPHGAAVVDAIRRSSPDLMLGPSESSFPSLTTAAVVMATTVATTRTTRRRSGPLMVGRDHELAQVRERLDDARRGSGSLVLLGGEPGVGKTRLVEEVVREAAEQGMLSVVGRCQDGGSPPYGPFIEILDALARALPEDAMRDVLGDDADELARIVPRVRRRDSALAGSVAVDPDQQRRALFAAVTDVLGRLSARQPLVLVLDDLHWGDEVSVALLEALLARVDGLPVLLVVTYRDIETDIAPPFRRALSGFIRHSSALRITLRRLSREHVGQLLAALAKSTPPAALVDAIYEGTEGNAFFVRELYLHLADDGHLFDANGHWRADLTVSTLDVPEGVRVVIGRRLGRLDKPTQDLLTAAAVVGRHFELRTIEAVGPLREDALLEALEAAEAARLIVAGREGRHPRYAFTHELIRSTLLADLSLPRRQRLHARVAEALEQQPVTGGGTVPAQLLAYHCFEAGPMVEDARTLRYLVRASDDAMATGAVPDAQAALARALSLVDPSDTPARLQLLWKHGLARRAAGELMEAIAEWEEALALDGADQDPALMANVCHDLAHGYAWTGRGLMGVAVTAKALERLDPAPSINRCRLTGSQGWNFALACNFAEAEPRLRDALQMAEAIGDPRLVGEALLLNSWHYYLCMRRREQADTCERAAELLRASGDTSGFGEALVNYQLACAQLGRTREIARTEREVRALAERLGRFDIRVHQRYAEVQRAWMVTGDASALEAGFQWVEEVSGAWRWVAEGSMTQARLWRGDLAGARAMGAEAISHEPPGTTHSGFGWGTAFLALALSGQRSEALALLDANRTALPVAGQLNTIGSWSALFKVVEGLVALNELSAAGSLYPLVVESLATESLVAFDGSHLLETVAAMAAYAAGDWTRATDHATRAIELADGMPFVSEQAESRAWLARARRAQGDPAASVLAADAVARFSQLGLSWHAERWRG